MKYLLCDLDETLYPATNGLMPAIGDRMRLYLQENYNLDPVIAHELQRRYWLEYGTTLRGLMLERNIDPQHYLEYVHDVSVADFVSPDPRLRRVLESIPYEKVIVTNADAPHAERVLHQLGVADQFARIFDIVFMEFECKPARGAYERVLRALEVPGEECILVEDMARNLPAARELGIRTILLKNIHAFNQPGAWLPDPAAQKPLAECPPDADLCIDEIYQLDTAVRQLAASGLRAPSVLT
jgi:putative hydrolase of the HAD superfamily